MGERSKQTEFKYTKGAEEAREAPKYFLIVAGDAERKGFLREYMTITNNEIPTTREGLLDALGHSGYVAVMVSDGSSGSSIPLYEGEARQNIPVDALTKMLKNEMILIESMRQARGRYQLEQESPRLARLRVGAGLGAENLDKNREAHGDGDEWSDPWADLGNPPRIRKRD